MALSAAFGTVAVDTPGDITKDGLLIVGEEECLVFYDGAAKGPAELISFDLVLRRRRPIPGIEDQGDWGRSLTPLAGECRHGECL